MPTKVALLWFLLIPLFLFSQETQKESTRIEWESVEGANLYLLEIRQGDTVIHTIETEMSYIPLFLSPGSYTIRISVVNKFNKVSSQGNWSPLVVATHPQPVIMGVTPTFCFDDVETITLSIRGDGFENNCQFFLISGTREILGEIVLKEGRGENTSYLVTFDAKYLVRREFWDLQVINPSSGKNFVVQSSLRVGERDRPVLKIMEPDELFYEVNPGRIMIEGKDFTEEVELIFAGPGDVNPTDIQVKPKEITFLLNFDTLPVGEYYLTIMNNTGLTSESILFTIKERPLSKSEKAQKNREVNPHFVAVYTHSSFLTGDADEIYNESFLGLGVVYRRRFNNPGVFTLPFFRYAGLMGSFDSTYLTFQSDSSRALITNHLNMGIYYLSDTRFPVNFYLSIQAGMSMSYITYPDTDTISSTDFTHNYEVGIQYDGFKFGILEAGIAMSMIHFTDNTMESVNPYLMLGRNF